MQQNIVSGLWGHENKENNLKIEDMLENIIRKIKGYCIDKTGKKI